MKDVLGLNDPTHPLFGRRIEIVQMPCLEEEKAREFLFKGFQQIGTEISDGEIVGVLGYLDGLIGWLSLYGYERAITQSPDPLNKVMQIAKAIVKAEVRQFLKNKKNHSLYIAILKYAKKRHWKELLSLVRDEFGRVNNASFTRTV